MSEELTAINSLARRTVAAPDSFSPDTLDRLGIKADGPQAAFTLGEKGPGGQNLAFVYAKDDTATMAINLNAGTITLISGEGETLQAVDYNVDVESMLDTVITVGETFEVTFSYDGKLFKEKSIVVYDWVAVTGPQYTKLSDRLPVDTTVAQANADIATAQGLGRAGAASRPPRSAIEVGSTIAVPGTDEPINLTNGASNMPEEIQTFDPLLNKRFVGRIWEKPGQSTTPRKLADAGYQFAAVEFTDGKTGILLFDFMNGLGIQIKARKQTIECVLSPDAMDTPLGPGARFNTEVISSFDGDTSQHGPFASPPMKYAVGIGPVAKANVDYRQHPIMEEFRGLTADTFLDPAIETLGLSRSKSDFGLSA